MEIGVLLPWIVIALVAFVVLRIVLGAIKSSAKLMLWIVIAIVGLGGGFLWLQNQPEAARPALPTLNIGDR